MSSTANMRFENYQKKNYENFCDMPAIKNELDDKYHGMTTQMFLHLF